MTEAVPSEQWARRSQALGVPSTRGYLLTVLGEFVLPVGGRVWTAALLDALGALGVEERTARQAVWRSAERGLLESERIGRRTRWALSDAATRLLTEGTRRIYSLHREPRPWDGRWLLLYVSVPESQRDLRHRMRTRLGWVGLRLARIGHVGQPLDRPGDRGPRGPRRPRPVRRRPVVHRQARGDRRRRRDGGVDLAAGRDRRRLRRLPRPVRHRPACRFGLRRLRQSGAPGSRVAPLPLPRSGPPR